MAGIGGPQPIHEFTIEDHEKTMDVNLRGVLLGMKYGIRAMLEAGNGGAIVNWSSVGGLNASTFGTATYSASKAGVIAVTKAGAVEYGDQGIRVNAICPGFILSEIMGAAGREHFPEMFEKAALGRAGRDVGGGRGRRVPRVRPRVVRQRRHHPGGRRLVGQARLTFLRFASRAPTPHRITPDSLRAPISSHDKPSSSNTASVCSPCSGARAGSPGCSSNCTGEVTNGSVTSFAHVDLGDVAVRLHLRVVVELTGCLHRCPLALEVGERVPPRVEVARREHALQPRDAFPRVRLPRIHVDEARVGRHLGLTERGAEVGPRAIGRQHHQRDEPTVGGAIGKHERVPSLVTARRARVDVLVAELGVHDVGLDLPHPGREEGRVDHRGNAGRRPLVQRGADRARDRRDRRRRRRTRGACRSARRASGCVNTCCIPLRAQYEPVSYPPRPASAARAERGAAHVDARRVVGADRVDVETQAAAGVGAQARHEHVGRVARAASAARARRGA